VLVSSAVYGTLNLASIVALFLAQQALTTISRSTVPCHLIKPALGSPRISHLLFRLIDTELNESELHIGLYRRQQRHISSTLGTASANSNLTECFLVQQLPQLCRDTVKRSCWRVGEGSSNYRSPDSNKNEDPSRLMNNVNSENQTR
jgi:hypothetical protein